LGQHMRWQKVLLCEELMNVRISVGISVVMAVTLAAAVAVVVGRR